jgi:hypothetical protein
MRVQLRVLGGCAAAVTAVSICVSIQQLCQQSAAVTAVGAVGSSQHETQQHCPGPVRACHESCSCLSGLKACSLLFQVDLLGVVVLGSRKAVC